MPGVTWFTASLLASGSLHASLTLIRPMLTYRALEIGVEPAFLGLVAAAFALAPLMVAIPLGRVIDRGHESRFALMGAVSVIGAAVVLAADTSLIALVACSAILGIGHLAIIVAIQGLIANASAPDQYARRFAHLGLAAATGQLIGPALGGFVAGDGSSAGTSAALLAGAILAVAALPFLLVMRSGDRSVDRSSHRTGAPMPIATILRSPGMIAAMLASLTVGSAVDVLMVYLPAFGEAAGWTPTEVGLLLAVRAGASILSRLVLGSLTDRFGRDRLLAGSMVVAAGTLVALSFSAVVAVAFVVMVVAGFALGLGQPLTIAAVATHAEPGTQATALSVRLMGNRVGQVAVPVTAGLVAGVTGIAGVIAITGLAVGLSTVAVVAGGGGAMGTRRSSRD
jgi:MFS family permease